MELKVWVDGIQRVVCGISDQTTCQEVIYALAHATGKTGRFVLVEKWRTSERSLSPHDKPLELLLKWGEYSNDVQFVLRCLEESSSSASKSPTPLREKSPLAVNPVANRPPSNVANNTVGHSNKRPVVRGPTPTPEPQRLKPYFVDASRPAPESGTLRPAQQRHSPQQQHVRYSSEIPQNLAVQQTTVLAGLSNSRPESRNGRASNLGLTVLSQSAHENISASAFGGVGNNSSLMESSFSSSDLHNMSGASCQSSLSSGSRRQPVPPSPSQLHPTYPGAKGSSPGRRRPPPPSYDQVMSHRRNYTNLLISPTQSATGSRSGTPVITSTGNAGHAPSPNLFSNHVSSTSNQWPANRDQLLKIVESQQHIITQQENKIRAVDSLLDFEKQKMIETENQYYIRDLDQIQKEIQQLEVRRVHIKQNVEDLRRQEFDAQMTANRQSYMTTSSECRSLKEKTTNFDRELSLKQNIAEKLNFELNKDFVVVSSASEFDSGVGSDLNEFDAKLIEFEEMIREKKKLIDKLENTLAKESSLDLLTNSLSNLKQLQIDNNNQHNNNNNGQQDKTSMGGGVIKETTPGVWV